MIREKLQGKFLGNRNIYSLVFGNNSDFNMNDSINMVNIDTKTSVNSSTFIAQNFLFLFLLDFIECKTSWVKTQKSIK